MMWLLIIPLVVGVLYWEAQTPSGKRRTERFLDWEYEDEMYRHREALKRMGRNV